MSTVSDVMRGSQSAQTAAAEAAHQSQASKTSKVGGRTVGNPQLTEQGAKYYDELRRKNPDKEFVLVSKDQKDMAQAQAASYAKSDKMVVLIDEEKIERMATDESYRKQYEGIIAKGASQLKQLAQKLTASGANVKGFGMQVKDNRASFFAAVDKGFKDQRGRIEKRRTAKKEAKKAEAKKEAKKAADEKRQERIEEKRADGRRTEDAEAEDFRAEDLEIFTADSIDELMGKVDDFVFADMSNHVWTESERQIGQHVDYSL